MTIDTPPNSDQRAEDRRLRHKRKRRRTTWTLIVCVAIIVIAALVAVGIPAWKLHRSIADGTTYVPNVLPDNSDRPPATKKGTENILFLGSDKRPKGSSVTGQRSDVMILVHVDADHKKAYAVSFPRDLWVPVDGHGHQKINAAMAFGGLPLAVKTVEELTNVRLDHVAMIDFKGFAAMTNTLGGVTVDVPKTFSSRGVHFTEGPQKLNGKEALVFVRERHAFRDGDFQRMRDQQAFLKALLNKTLSMDTLSDFSKTENLASTVAPYLTVDRDFTTLQMAKLGWSMRGIRSGDITFLTAPNNGTGRAGKADIVKLDEPGLTKLGKAISNDTMGDYLAKNS